MKKLFTLAILLILISSLTACGSSNSGEKSDLELGDIGKEESINTPTQIIDVSSQYQIQEDPFGKILPVKNDVPGMDGCWVFLDANTGEVLYTPYQPEYITITDKERQIVAMGYYPDSNSFYSSLIVDADTGEVLFDENSEYEKIGIPGDGVIPVYKDGYWGYINYETKEVCIDFLFQYGGAFSNGQAVIKVNEKYGVIDSAGAYVLKPMFSYVGGVDDFWFATTENNSGYPHDVYVYSHDGEELVSEALADEKWGVDGWFAPNRIYYYRDYGFLLVDISSPVYSSSCALFDLDGNLISEASLTEMSIQKESFDSPVFRNGFLHLDGKENDWILSIDGTTKSFGEIGLFYGDNFANRPYNDKTWDIVSLENNDSICAVIPEDRGHTCVSFYTLVIDTFRNYKGEYSNLCVMNGTADTVLGKYADMDLFPTTENNIYPDAWLTGAEAETNRLRQTEPSDYDRYVPKPAIIVTEEGTDFKGLYYDGELIYEPIYHDIFYSENGFSLLMGGKETFVSWEELDNLVKAE